MERIPLRDPADRRSANTTYRFIATAARLTLSLFGRLEVVGTGQVPADGGVIVANHIGWLDPLWIGLAVWPRPVFFMAKRELFIPVFGSILRSAGVFPVDRGAPGPSALKLPLEILANGGLLVIFPGGTRSLQLDSLKRGAATIATLANKPILPVHYAGPARLRLRDLLHRPTVTVELMPYILPPERNGAKLREVTETLSNRIGEAIHGDRSE
ncbi:MULTISPECIES: lysophospholipid acyltransferase family protein [unclassified Sphingomonas]|uniref:lysophospholipid acyltransferase family protein n=1 Tax=unclassified Sphingomonas TaxID=196159 RepID=UPI0006FDA736|nr:MULTISPECIES: lysophospholipid acyltransferase family protein [unclassified Sphingomonas]KQM56941.1 hypothetical protein ASE65_13845 [Sphingomonas sp. Leaf16]KQN09312.1 hypothetical protein ASE81_13890 [Sphingomonas sp. Leaf29]KQN17491.1 hypothetical protein ASE83_13825 [Sphingomonas sp. Leaf32]